MTASQHATEGGGDTTGDSTDAVTNTSSKSKRVLCQVHMKRATPRKQNNHEKTGSVLREQSSLWVSWAHDWGE